MCLAIPGKIKEINGHEVLVEYPGEARKALVGDEAVKVGDYVMVQMGIVINTISEEEAKVAQRAWKNTSGFSNLVILITVVVVAVVVSYLYLSPRAEKDKEAPSENTPNTLWEAKEDADSKTPANEPKEKHIAEWESYTSDRFGFRFDNPGGFFLVTTYEDHYPDQGHITIYENRYWDFITGPPQPRSGPPSIGVSAFQNVNGLSLVEWATINDGIVNYDGDHVQTSVGGSEAVRYTWEGMFPGETVLIKKDGYEYIVDISTVVDNDKLSSSFEEILDSFEFVD